MPIDLAQAQSFDARQRDFYWKEKDIRAVVSLSRQALSHLQQTTDPEVRSVLKGIAYNAASFTWPGWDEPGIELSAGDIAFGRECAELNLKLAIELNRPPKGVANAHWMIGAHHLAAKNWDLAIASFQSGQTFAQQINDEAFAKMFLAYESLAHLLAGKSTSDSFNEFIDAFKKIDSDDAREYARQLEVALNVFTR